MELLTNNKCWQRTKMLLNKLYLVKVKMVIKICFLNNRQLERFVLIIDHHWKYICLLCHKLSLISKLFLAKLHPSTTSSFSFDKSLLPHQQSIPSPSAIYPFSFWKISFSFNRFFLLLQQTFLTPTANSSFSYSRFFLLLQSSLVFFARNQSTARKSFLFLSLLICQLLYIAWEFLITIVANL